MLEVIWDISERNLSVDEVVELGISLLLASSALFLKQRFNEECKGPDSSLTEELSEVDLSCLVLYKLILHMQERKLQVDGRSIALNEHDVVLKVAW